jgi:hypothetical protein
VKTLLAVVVAALLAFGLVACGGGDDDSTTSPTTTATTADGERTAPAPGDDARGGGNEKQIGDDKSTSSGGGAGSPEKDEPGGNSSAGEGSAAFRTPGGDNSIQNYGGEGDEDQREAAEAAVIAYFDARAAGDWAKTCEYFAAAGLKPLEQLAESSPQLKGKGCAAIMGALGRQLSAAQRANPVTEGIASLRIEDGQGFALFHGRNGADYFLPILEEDGEWKVGTLTASEFPSAAG